MCNLDVILACSYQILLSFVYFSLPLIPMLFANAGVLRPPGLKENTVCVHLRTPRRSSLPYDTATLSSLLDPFTVPTGNTRTMQHLLHGTSSPLEEATFTPFYTISTFAQHSICSVWDSDGTEYR